MKRLKALIFDVDGTLADTERYGHLPACNDAFRELGLPLHWSWEEFKAMLHIPGNANRLRRVLTQHSTLNGDEIEAVVQDFAELKQKIYIETYLPRLPLRPGIRRIIAEAVEQQVNLAIVSTSHERQIRALVHSQLGEFADHFHPILGKESGQKTGEEGILYGKCLTLLGLPADSVLVIEDSESGAGAAIRAGLPCAVFYNDYTRGQNFAGAALVARSIEFFDLKQLEALCLER